MEFIKALLGVNKVEEELASNLDTITEELNNASLEDFSNIMFGEDSFESRIVSFFS